MEYDAVPWPWVMLPRLVWLWHTFLHVHVPLPSIWMCLCLKKCFRGTEMAAKIATHSYCTQTLSSQTLRQLHGQQCLKKSHQYSPPSSKRKKQMMTTRASLIHLQEPIAISQQIFKLAAAAETQGYSVASYYTSLGLFVISVPGLWSLIKRSVKSKIVKKTFIDEENKPPNQAAGEILSFFTRNNFVVTDRGETVTFEGVMAPSRGQAALLTFCTCISLASVALVLTITVPDVGNNWFWLTALSPLAGAYYWKRASRKEQIQVKMIVSEDGKVSEIVVQGDDQQIDEMRKELKLNEKGMVYVKGIFER